MRANITYAGIEIAHVDVVRKLGARKTNAMLHYFQVRHEQRMGNKTRTHVQALWQMHGKLLVFAPTAREKLQRLMPLQITDARAPVQPQAFACSIELDANQEIVAQNLLKNFDAINQQTLVMDTGLGKTYIACWLIARLRVRTLVVVPSKAILQGWLDALRTTTAEFAAYTSGDAKLQINVAIINTAVKQDVSWFRDFDCIVYDEIHSYSSPARQDIFFRTCARYRLGLTATPNDHAFGMDAVWQHHCAPLVRAATLPGFNPKLTHWNITLHKINYIGPPQHTRKIINATTGWTSYMEMLTQFAHDEYRTRLIAQLVCRALRLHCNVFVFFQTREFAETLQTVLEHDAVILMGGSDANDLQRAHAARVVLTTYSFGFQGLSLPHMDAIILAAPRMAKFPQILGRMLRTGSSAHMRHLYDIVDTETDLGSNQYRERKKHYVNSRLITWHTARSENHTWQDYKN